MLKQLLNNYISKTKGSKYQIDQRIPGSYLLGVVRKRMAMKIRGFFCRIDHKTIPFIGKRVTIKAKKKFHTGSGISIDDACYIDALSENGIRFGNNVSVGKRTKIECTGNLQFLGKGLTVGNNVGLGSDNFYGCAGGITIGDDTIIGNFVSFHAENHIYSDPAIPIRLQGVTHEGIHIGKNCWIGAKVTILDGVIIEDNCIIAAGALVTAGTYRQNGIYGGSPAKLLKMRD